MELKGRYEKIINFMCEYKKIPKEEIFKVLNNKECRYILLLLLKKYKCTNITELNCYFPKYSKRSFNYGFKKAEENFFINKDFRDEYFEVKDYIEKTL